MASLLTETNVTTMTKKIGKTSTHLTHLTTINIDWLNIILKTEASNKVSIFYDDGNALLVPFNRWTSYYGVFQNLFLHKCLWYIVTNRLENSEPSWKLESLHNPIENNQLM